MNAETLSDKEAEYWRGNEACKERPKPNLASQFQYLPYQTPTRDIYADLKRRHVHEVVA
jgi:hypothetical protein